MQAGANADLFREIRAVTRKIPCLKIGWMKVQVRRDQDQHDVNEMLNIAMGKLANTINFENRFHSKNKSRSF